jgi:hypothetical protein
VSTLQHRATGGSLDHSGAENIHHCGFCGTSDISAMPMDVIEINRLLPWWSAA